MNLFVYFINAQISEVCAFKIYSCLISWDVNVPSNRNFRPAVCPERKHFHFLLGRRYHNSWKNYEFHRQTFTLTLSVDSKMESDFRFMQHRVVSTKCRYIPCDASPELGRFRDVSCLQAARSRRSSGRIGCGPGGSRASSRERRP